MTNFMPLGPTHVIWIDRICHGPSIQYELVFVSLGPLIHYEYIGLFICAESKGLSIVYDVYLRMGPLITI
jgi:hypothetical protein